MFYIIPAWYQKNTWNEIEQVWYERKTQSEFDDSVKQIQLFHRFSDMDYQILLLSYSPNLRHFLHRQGVYRAPYWSCFDAIQCVTKKQIYVLSYHNISWPDGIEFIYSPFAVIAMLNGHKYAQIEFGEEGNPIRIDMFKDDVIVRRNQYDDRGFVSSSIIYNNGEAILRDFFTQDGDWKLRYFFNDEHVEINPKCPFYLIDHNSQEDQIPNIQFQKTRYDSLEAVIYEVFVEFLKNTSVNDIYCEAMHDRHRRLLYDALVNRKTMLSFFGERYLLAKHPDDRDIIQSAGCIIVDEMDHAQKIIDVADYPIDNIVTISPYDTRLDSGISEQLSVQKVLIPIDGLDDDVMRRLIIEMSEFMEDHPKVRIHLFTRDSGYSVKDRTVDKIKGWLLDYGINNDIAEEEFYCESENVEIDNEQIEKKFVIEQQVSELEVGRTVREQRIVLDIRNNVDLYLQVSAVSFGIPQIVLHESQFVKHKQNGLIINSIEDVADALKYYLDVMKNWNEAQINSYRIGRQHTTEVLVDKWKEAIESLE